MKKLIMFFVGCAIGSVLKRKIKKSKLKTYDVKKTGFDFDKINKITLNLDEETFRSNWVTRSQLDDIEERLNAIDEKLKREENNHE